MAHRVPKNERGSNMWWETVYVTAFLALTGLSRWLTNDVTCKSMKRAGNVFIAQP